MGGGIATPELAAAVSRAGALGSIGIQPVRRFARDLRLARDLARGRPIAANLLVPFASSAHVDACIDARVSAVVLFFGYRRDFVARLRAAGIFVLHQVGTPAQAQRALLEGADALIAQGLEAGGHLLGVEPAAQVLRRLLDLSDGKPVLIAGGVTNASDVRAAIDAGAAGVLAGSRFLLTEESNAHPAYRRRLLGAQRTLVTRLFGVGWRARHRVVPNLATERWAPSGSDPWWVAALQRASVILQKLPAGDGPQRLVRLQRLWLPLFTPVSPSREMDEDFCEIAPLYAGEGVRRVTRVLPAAEAVADLARGL